MVNNLSSITRPALAWAVCFLPTAAFAQSVPDYDFDWVTIGAPGNAGYEGNEFGTAAGWGDVAYEYRLSRTEVTNHQWLGFINAYWPYYSGDRSSLAFTGEDIAPATNDPSSPPGYGIFDGRESWGADLLGWRVVAAYCNWLHNDQRTDAAAFMSGAYDLSTFTQNPDGSFNDQITRSPDARFWIPSLDEWVKAVYYDPNRYGPGMGGYWTQPNGSDTPLISGLPGVGTTNAGTLIRLPVGQYPDSQTPWGLLDASGGNVEWLEDPANLRRSSRLAKGTAWHDVAYFLNDRITGLDSGGVLGVGHGLRVASTVPCPGFAVWYASIAVFKSRRKRRSV